MRNYLPRFFFVLAIVVVFSLSAFGQNTSTGSLTGTVVDPQGLVVVGASVTVKSVSNQEYTAVTNGEGTFTIPALGDGVYSATIVAKGFKQAVVTDIKVTVGTPSSIKVALEIGAGTETVTVVGGGELVQTQTATVGTSITGRQITELPYASRNALDLLLFLPGTSTAGRPRQSTVNGLPKAMLNITLDGINIQDNVLKGSDGFFTIIQPKTDAIQEVSVSTSTPGAESNSEGAIQIKFTTRHGESEFHGSGYWTHRDKSLNGNFFWNNELLAPKPHFDNIARASDRAPRTNSLLNQPGVRVGGPLIVPHLLKKGKAFFFINYEEYRLPEAQLRTRTVLSPSAVSGIFTYGTHAISLYTVAAASNCGTTLVPVACESTPDPTIAALLASTRAVAGSYNVLTDPNLQTLSFTNQGGQKRQFPTARFDFEVNKNNHIDTIYNYQIFRSKVDFLNNADPFAPGFPNFGSQDSNRYSSSTGWRSTIKSNLVNEARVGVQNGIVLFFPQNNAGQFTNQGGFSQNINAPTSVANVSLGISTVTTINNPQRRNTPTNQLSDNLSWIKGKHTLNFGGDISSVSTFLQNAVNGAVPTIGYGQDTSDVIETAMFTAGNFPGSTSTQRNQADALYRVLTGRLSSISHTASLGEDGTTYTLDQTRIQRYRQREFGLYGQDSWRFRPNLTLNFGLRLETVYAPISQNKGLTQTTFAGLFSSSGTDLSALFRPGATGGSLTTFTPLPPGLHPYNTAHNLAPTFGFAYQPNFKHGLLRRLAGNSGQTVLRGGWAMAFDREGLNLVSSILGANFGGTVSLTQTAGTSFARGSLFRSLPAAPVIPVVPSTPAVLDRGSANAFLPNLKTPYVISFSGSIQRELNKDTVIEIGYVGNRGHQLLRQFNLNEINVIENGFTNEFRLAQANLLANIAAGRCQTGVVAAGCSANFAYFGPGTGTFPLPFTLGYFYGAGLGTMASPFYDPSNPAQYTNSFFRNGSFTGALASTNSAPLTFAGLLNNPLNGLTGNAAAANGSVLGLNKFPSNLFIVNPQMAINGSFLVNNDGKTWYDAFTVELRRRLSKGILASFNYTLSKAQGNEFVSSATASAQPNTLRNTWLNKDFSPFDLRQSLKGSYIVELPMGRGKKFMSNAHGMVNHLVGDWTINGTMRISSGVPLNLGNVQLVGMTRSQLEDNIRIRKTVDHKVFWLPDDIVQNTILAFATTGTTLTGYSGAAPTGRFIAPAGLNCPQQFSGQCGFTTLIIHGPRFTRFDVGIEKKFKISETKNFELRFEFLNALNNIDWRLGSYNNDTVTIGANNADIPTYSLATFGQLLGSNTAYRDVSTTNDPGGRVGQIVMRFNF
ncbi:MAG TPA: TonB-dependent receptor [Pyrinomonadaceae bacterium]|nr:TonB-dependent receptor [Pyrinomonadaceae bacterium]